MTAHEKFRKLAEVELYPKLDLRMPALHTVGPEPGLR